MFREVNIIAIALNESLVVHFLLSVSLFKSKPKKSKTEDEFRGEIRPFYFISIPKTNFASALSGYQLNSAECVDIRLKRVVPDHYCHYHPENKKPKPKLKECNMDPCPSRSVWQINLSVMQAVTKEEGIVFTQFQLILCLRLLNLGWLLHVLESDTSASRVWPFFSAAE